MSQLAGVIAAPFTGSVEKKDHCCFFQRIAPVAHFFLAIFHSENFHLLKTHFCRVTARFLFILLGSKGQNKAERQHKKQQFFHTFSPLEIC